MNAKKAAGIAAVALAGYDALVRPADARLGRQPRRAVHPAARRRHRQRDAGPLHQGKTVNPGYSYTP